jgi:sugar lactone lactonase YvrE
MGSKTALYSVAIVILSACWLAGCARDGTTAQPQASASPSISYITSWGVRGEGPGQLDQPACIATDRVGNVYVVDAGSHFVEKFNPQGTPLLAFQEDVLKHPQAITIDSGGAIYVTDSGSGSAYIYFPNGDHYRQFRVVPRPNIENELGIAVGEDGVIHVLDTQAGKVTDFTSRIRRLRIWKPVGKTADDEVRAMSMAIAPDGDLFLADASGNRIMRYTADGRFESEIDARADGMDRKLGDRLAVSRSGVFVMDADGLILHVWSLDGKPKLDVDLALDLGQTRRAAPALAVSPRQELLVLDAPEARVLRYRINF